MSNVDNRIVNMQFNNAQFEKNISTSLSSIEKLKQGLKFEGVKDSVSKINNSVKGVTLSGLTNAAEQVKLKFSAMEVAAVTALSNIANSAVNAGKQMIESLTIEPISQGFEEYEMTMDAVQTIMNGSGRSLEEVNEVLDDLNTYADRTIYSFSDMKSSIGKFVNAGVDLYDAADAIKGISNEAALAGASTQQASQAMYNFSQAISSGSVKLIDWRSINNATMDTVEFKNELIKTALQLGTVVEEEGHFISTTTDANGNISDAFTATTGWNESLSSQWLTTNVLVETLKKYTDETTELGQRAYASAQDIKTFTQMMSTLKESVGSGWAVTFQTIFGDFKESKALWTEVSNIITKFLDEQTNGRNALLADWKKLGGRESLFNALKNTLEGVFKVINSIKQGFHDIFPPVTARQLSTASARIEEITENFVNNEGLFNNIRSVVRGIFSTVKIGVNIVKGLWSFSSPILKVVSKGLFAILGFLSDIITFINSLITNSKVVTNTFGFLSSAVSKVIDGIKWLISKIRDFFASISSSKVKDFSEEVEGTVTPVNKASEALEKATDRVQWFKDKWNSLVEWFKNNEVINTVIEKVRNAIANVTLAIRQFMNGTKGLESSGEKLNVFQKIGEWLSAAWTKIKEFFSNIGPTISSLWKLLKVNMSNLAESVRNGKDALVEFFGADSLLDLIKQFVAVLVKLKLSKLLSNMGSWFKKLSEGTGLSNAATSISNFFTSLSSTLNNFGKSKTTIKDVGKSILMIAAAIYIISTIEQEDLTKAASTVAMIFAILTVAAKAITSFSSDWKGDLGISAIFKTFSSAILKISLIIALLSWLTSKTDIKNVWAATKVINNIAVVLAAFTILLTRFGKSNVSSGTIATLSLIIKVMSTSLMKIGAIIAILSLFKQDKVKSASLIISGITILLGLFAILVAKFANVNVKSVAIMIAFIKIFSTAIVKIGVIIGILSLFSPEKVILSTTVLAVMTALFAGMMLLTKIVDKDSILNLGISIAAASTAVLLFASAVKKLSKLDPEKMILSVGTILAVVLVLSVLGGVLSTLHLDVGILTLAAAMLLFGVAVLAFSKGISTFVDAIEKMNNLGTKGITGATNFIDAFVEKAPSWAEKTISAIITALMSLTTKMAELLVTFLVAVINEVTKNAATIVEAITSLITAIVKSIKATTTSFKMEELVATLGAVAIMAAIIFLLSYASTYSSGAYKSILIIALILVEIVAAVLIIDKMSTSPENAIKILSGIAETVLGFSGIIVMVAALAALMQGVGKGDAKLQIGFTTMLKAVAIIGLIVLGMVVLVSLIGIVANWIKSAGGDPIGDLEYAKEIMFKVGEGLGSLITGFAKPILGLFKSGNGMFSAMAGVAALLVSVSLITPLLPLMALFLIELGALGKAMDDFFGEGTTEETFETAAKVMGGIGKSLGELIGGFISGFIDALANGFIETAKNFATGLSEMMKNLQPFLNSVSEVDGSTVSAALNIAKMLLAFTAVEILQGITSWITGGVNFEKFGKDLEDLAPHLVNFSNKLKEGEFDADLVSKSASAAKVMAEFANSLPKENGLWQLIAGKTMDMKTFGEKLEGFGTSIVKYGKSVESITEPQIKAIEKTTSLSGDIVKLANNMPKTNGLWQLIAGKSDIAEFGEKVSSFGGSMVEYAEKVSSIDENQVEAAKRATTMGESLATLATHLPATDGFWQLIAGANEIDEFGKKIKSFGNSMVDYAIKVSLLNDGHVESAARSVKMAEKVAALAEHIPTTGGISDIAGTKKIDEFGGKIASFGASIVAFSTTVSNLDIKNLTRVDKVLEIAKKLAEISKEVTNSDGLDALSKGLAGFAESSVESFNNVFYMRTDDAIGAASDFIGAVARGIYNNKNNTKEQVKNSITEIVNSAIDVINGANSDIEEKVKGIVQSQIDIINSYTGEGHAFYNAGDNAVQGLIDGIKSRIQDAKTAGFDLGYAVYEGTKKGLKEKSPSHIMRDDVAFNAVKGLVLGVKDKLSMVQSSGKEMGSTLYEGTKQSILKIANSVNDNMDLRPVISPVLDLSDVESGAGQIDGMLNSTVSSNLAGYTSQLIDGNRMSNYELQINQNGSKEVVSAINNLTSRMDSLEEAILNRPINLDGKKVSKIVAPGINKELGIMQSYARRGN